MLALKEKTYSILIVDENEETQAAFASSLTQDKYRVIFAGSGAQALDILRSQAFDLVLLDLLVPMFGDQSLLTHMQSDETLRRIPVIAVSEIGDDGRITQSIEQGATDFLLKPVNQALFKVRLSAWLERKRQSDQEEKFVTTYRRDLEIGRKIQADFLPETLPDVPGYELAAFFKPAREVAGDFYDVISLRRNRIGLVIADVCDKGVGAALFMALTRSLIRVLAENAGGRVAKSAAFFDRLDATASASDVPIDISGLFGAVALTNDYITEKHGNANMFATLFFGVLDANTNELYYVNGGHDAPVHIGGVGIKGRLKRTGIAVGAIPGAKYSINHIALAPGDTLFMYTDGVPEARSLDGSFFTEARLLALIEALRADGEISVQSLVARITAEVNAHVDVADPSDDVTMLAIHRYICGSDPSDVA